MFHDTISKVSPKCYEKRHPLVSHRMKKVTSQSPKVNISGKLSERGEAGLGGWGGRRREEAARKEDFCVTCFLIAQSSSHSACRDTCIHTTAGVGASVAASPRSEPHFVHQLGFACSLVAPVNSAVAMKDERGEKWFLHPSLP